MMPLKVRMLHLNFVKAFLFGFIKEQMDGRFESIIITIVLKILRTSITATSFTK